MNKRMLWSRILSVVGLAMMAIGVLALVGLLRVRRGGLPIDGLWGFLLGSGLVALGANLGRSLYRRFLYMALGLTVCGLTTVILVAMMYFEAENLPWWTYVVFACPICGGIMSLVGAVLVIVESFRRPPVPQDSVATA
jgi:predicted membrane protein